MAFKDPWPDPTHVPRATRSGRCQPTRIRHHQGDRGPAPARRLLPRPGRCIWRCQRMEGDGLVEGDAEGPADADRRRRYLPSYRRRPGGGEGRDQSAEGTGFSGQSQEPRGLNPMWMRLFRAVLRCAPRSFRERYGDEVPQYAPGPPRGGSEQPGADGGGRWRTTVAHVRELIGLVAVVIPLWWVRVRNERRTGGRGEVMGGWIQDLRVSLRGLRRNPGFATSALVVVALGIGATTAIFSAANLLLFP